MRTVAEHLNTCLSLVAPLDPLDVLLPDAVGCVLAEDVSAPFDLPVTDQATLDGYAVRSQDVGGAGKMRQVFLDVIAEVKAGDAEPCTLVENSAVRIASGAPLPVGADTVVPLEETGQGKKHFATRPRRKCGHPHFTCRIAYWVAASSVTGGSRTPTGDGASPSSGSDFVYRR